MKLHSSVISKTNCEIDFHINLLQLNEENGRPPPFIVFPSAGWSVLYQIYIAVTFDTWPASPVPQSAPASCSRNLEEYWM